MTRLRRVKEPARSVDRSSGVAARVGSRKAMFIRQRLLLALLREASSPLQATSLVKLAFLLREESVVGSDRTFYDFVPYKFGPFSFALYREVHNLEQNGFVVKENDRFAVAADRAEEVLDLARSLPVETALAVTTVVREYGRLRHDNLLRSVYARYPWFALNTERADLCERKPRPRKLAGLAVYTAGYHEESIDAFLNRLLQKGIAGIADVRANPMSRKYGFAGSRLRDLSARVGLGYNHFPRLGIPSSRRRSLRTPDDYDALFRDYADDLLPAVSDEIDTLADACQESPTALLCAEADPRFCHRSVLAPVVAERTGLKVVHL